MSQSTIKINFDNEIAAESFMTWLNNSGQISYWKFMAKIEEEGDPVSIDEFDSDSEGHFTVVNFDYNYDDFEIDTELGRITKDEHLDYFGFKEED